MTKCQRENPQADSRGHVPSWTCSLVSGHEGPHVAIAGHTLENSGGVLAIWPNFPPPKHPAWLRDPA